MAGTAAAGSASSTTIISASPPSRSTISRSVCVLADVRGVRASTRIPASRIAAFARKTRQNSGMWLPERSGSCHPSAAGAEGRPRRGRRAVLLSSAESRLIRAAPTAIPAHASQRRSPPPPPRRRSARARWRGHRLPPGDRRRSRSCACARPARAAADPLGRASRTLPCLCRRCAVAVDDMRKYEPQTETLLRPAATSIASAAPGESSTAHTMVCITASFKRPSERAASAKPSRTAIGGSAHLRWMAPSTPDAHRVRRSHRALALSVALCLAAAATALGVRRADLGVTAGNGFPTRYQPGPDRQSRS